MRTSATESSTLSNAMSFINVGNQLLSTDPRVLGRERHHITNQQVGRPPSQALRTSQGQSHTLLNNLTSSSLFGYNVF